MYIKIPIQNEATEKIFRWSYARDLLMLLAKNPYDAFTVSEIIRRLDIRSRDALTKLIDAMQDAGLIESVRVGRKRFISINKKIVELPEKPIFQIPQEEYREVVKKILDQITNKSDKTAGKSLKNCI
jgi:predicted transcriptional regulator